MSLDNLDHSAIEKAVQECVAKLHEHIDVVHISVSWNDCGTCWSLHRGAGNWYARQGLAQEFIDQDKAKDVARRIGEEIQQPPPDGEEWKGV